MEQEGFKENKETEKENFPCGKWGMVLEGGAMRGMYTAGILDVFMEQGLWASAMVGVSAGAVFGCNYKSRQPGRTIRYNKRFCRDARYGNIRSFIKTGNIFDEEFCYHVIPEQLDPFDWRAFSENPMEFYVTCTDVHTGKPVYHLCEKGDSRDLKWMQASASMPLVSRVVTIEDQDLLDGGISDSIPVAWFRKQGYEKSVVVLTRPEGYRKEANKSLFIAKHWLKQYPELINAMAHRHENYNASLDEVARLEEKGDIFVFRPSRYIKISRTEKNPEKLQELYDLGRSDALVQIEALKSFLQR